MSTICFSEFESVSKDLEKLDPAFSFTWSPLEGIQAVDPKEMPLNFSPDTPNPQELQRSWWKMMKPLDAKPMLSRC